MGIFSLSLSMNNYRNFFSDTPTLSQCHIIARLWKNTISSILVHSKSRYKHVSYMKWQFQDNIDFKLPVINTLSFIWLAIKISSNKTYENELKRKYNKICGVTLHNREISKTSMAFSFWTDWSCTLHAVSLFQFLLCLCLSCRFIYDSLYIYIILQNEAKFLNISRPQTENNRMHCNNSNWL